ncbi:MAG: exopolyphosphatase [Chitinophagaceae bacterium]|nr:exopolyphosphatase [Chitinophagaceae bacterium]
MRLAAIDIGSNAARLLISEVTTDKNNTPSFNKLNLFRVPLRLGFEVFETGLISKEKTRMLLDTMKAFKHLTDAYQVKQIRACATSAMREASNALDIIRKVKLESGITIEVITGDMEAGLIFENHIAETLDKDHSYMYLDVGGGSTELSFFSNGVLTFKESFNIGTIRLLQGAVLEKTWEVMKEVIKTVTKGQKEVVAIGSGGNINKVFTMSKAKEGRPMSLDLLKSYYREFNSVTVAERMQLFNLKADRADVIVPALLIYTNAMRWAGAGQIYVPKIGLADGLVQHMWGELK